MRTTLSKAVLAIALPASFAFRVTGLEWVGGAVVLVGMAVALTGRRRVRRPAVVEVFESP